MSIKEVRFEFKYLLPHFKSFFVLTLCKIILSLIAIEYGFVWIQTYSKVY